MGSLTMEVPGRGCSTLGHDKLSKAICHSVTWQGVLPGMFQKHNWCDLELLSRIFNVHVDGWKGETLMHDG